MYVERLQQKSRNKIVGLYPTVKVTIFLIYALGTLLLALIPIRKFITVAAVLAMECEAVILDEPTAGQDLYGIELLHNIIAELHAQGKTVITITHDIEFAAENFQRIVVMAHRQILKDGTPEEVFADEPVLNEAMLKGPCSGRLARRLNLHGEILTNEQFLDAFCRIYERGASNEVINKEE